jgi:hypothetical protein
MLNCQRIEKYDNGLQLDDMVVIQVGELTIENKVQILSSNSFQ